MNHLKHTSSSLFNLVNERCFLRQPKHALNYCVAIAGTVATVVGAGASAYSAISSSQKSKAAAGAVGAGGAGAYGSKIDLPDYKSNVKLPGYNARDVIAQDYVNSLPQLNAISRGVTAQGVRDRNIAMPGASDLMSQASGVLSSMGHGYLNQDVVDETNRQLAERAGGAFDPSAPNQFGGAKVAPISKFAQEIGATSQQLQEKFLSAAPTWENLANQFAYTPDEAASTALDFLGKRYSYILGAGSLQNTIDENTYNAEVNKAKAAASPDPAVVGARNDALLSSILGNQANQQQGAAISGAIKGIGGALGGLGGAGGGDIYGNSGYISSANLGAAYSSFATPGYTPIFNNTPGAGYSFGGYA